MNRENAADKGLRLLCQLGTQNLHLFQPFGAFCFCGCVDRTDLGDSHRLDSAKMQDVPLHDLMSGLSVYPSVVPGWRIHRDDQMGGFPGQKLIPQRGIFTILIREAGQEDAIEKSL